MAKAPTKTPLPDNSLAPAKRTRAGTQDFFGIKPVVPSQSEATTDSPPTLTGESAPAAAPVEPPAAAPIESPAVPLVEAAAVPAPAESVATPPVRAAAAVEDERAKQKGEKELEPTKASPVGEGALPEYDWFLERKESDERTHAYISRDLYDNLVYVMQMVGDKKGFTLTSYLNNIISQHFDQYGPEIRKRIREKEALLKKKRRF